MASTAPTGERAIAGATHGIIGPNQTVTWRGRHFGFMLQHTSLIDRYDPPRYFRDVMLKGHFRSFEHEHLFEPTTDGRTLMHDRLRFNAPLGLLGSLTERLALKSYLSRFLRQRDAVIQRVAESSTEEWRNYIP